MQVNGPTLLETIYRMLRQSPFSAAGRILHLTTLPLVCLCATTLAGAAQTESSNAFERPPALAANWEGSYVGAHLAYGRGITRWGVLQRTGLSSNDVPATGHNDGLLGGLRLGYNKQYDQRLVGIESDVDFGKLVGYASCGSTLGVGGSGDTCQNRTDWMASLAARVGYATGRSLIYAKAGAAYAHDKLQATNDRVTPMPPASVSADHMGWLIGAGLLYALDSRWSVSAEYDYYDFGRHTYHLTANGSPASVTIAHTQYVAKLGLNYRLGDIGDKRMIVALGNDFRGEFGTRIGYSTGRFQKHLYDPYEHGLLLSVLTWSGQKGAALEAFARLDHQSGWFVKGTLGGLNLRSSHMHDEDTDAAMAPAPYSNTVSITKNGRTFYGTVDLGLMLTQNAEWDLGAFIGYGYYAQHLNAYGCQQVAGNPSVCSPVAIASNVLALSENEKWNVVRLGLAGNFMATQRLRVSGEIAWLPYAHLNSIDKHWLRPDINPMEQHWSSSRSFQVEASLAYVLSRQWSVGTSLRYLSLEADGSTRFPGDPDSPMRFRSSRATAYLQAVYRFDL